MKKKRKPALYFWIAFEYAMNGDWVSTDVLPNKRDAQVYAEEPHMVYRYRRVDK